MICGFRGLCGECFSPPPPGMDETEGILQEPCFPCVKLLTKPAKPLNPARSGLRTKKAKHGEGST